ncbi:MAG: hypothetical protein LBV50_07145 [Novosphingobium sp.]|jgi:hypothetical protein|nr:hypothetical protein [Novosphingobium sp.]
MRGIFVIIAAVSTVMLSAAGCSEQGAKSQAAIDFQKREEALIEQCRKIATDRDILMAKLDAMKSVYDPSMKREPEPDRAHECSVSDETNVENQQDSTNCEIEAANPAPASGISHCSQSLVRN